MLAEVRHLGRGMKDPDANFIRKGGDISVAGDVQFEGDSSILAMGQSLWQPSRFFLKKLTAFHLQDRIFQDNSLTRISNGNGEGKGLLESHWDLRLAEIEDDL